MMSSSSSTLSMVEARLPPGFRFHPRDDELVLDYLSKKLAIGAGAGAGAASGGLFPELVDVDLNKCEPWDLPGIACVGGKEWYLYSLKDRKYTTGQRTNRATESGYWKATGKDREITRKGLLVGMRKTLVFYRGRAPKGKRTDWVMHEFRKEQGHGHGDHHHHHLKDWVLCRVFYKSRTSSPRTTESTTATCDIDGATARRPPLPPPLVGNSASSDHAGAADEQAPRFFSSSDHRPSPTTMTWMTNQGQQRETTTTPSSSSSSLMKGLTTHQDDGFEGYYCLADDEVPSETWSSLHRGSFN